MKFYLSTKNDNLIKEFIRFKDKEFLNEKELKNHDLNKVILVSIDNPKINDLLRPFHKKILFRLEYLPVRKMPFDIFFYNLFFDFIFEWDSSYLRNSKSFLPFFPPRIGLVHEEKFVEEIINLNHFFVNQFKKPKLISTVISNKKNLSWQKARVDLIDFLTKELVVIERFGRGFNTIKDKSDALINFKYHIAIENCSNGPSEKLWDPLLCNCVVFYGGSLELVHPILRKAILQIPIFDKQKAKEIIIYELNSSQILNSLNSEDWTEIKKTIKRLYTFENQSILKRFKSA